MLGKGKGVVGRMFADVETLAGKKCLGQGSRDQK